MYFLCLEFLCNAILMIGMFSGNRKQRKTRKRLVWQQKKLLKTLLLKRSRLVSKRNRRKSAKKNV